MTSMSRIFRYAGTVLKKKNADLRIFRYAAEDITSKNVCIKHNEEKDRYYDYRSKERKKYMEDMGYRGHAQNHHIIPKCFEDHKVIINSDFYIHGRGNLLIMPTKKGIEKLNLNPKTVYHSAHPEYNAYVKEKLDYISEGENQNYNLWLFIHHLKKMLIKIE
jgi:hypothetical protein